MTEPITPDRIDTKFYPSILQQTHWQCGFFDFRKAQVPGISYFNCGLVRRPDGLWLVTRRSKNEKNIRIGFNDVVAWKMDENSMLPEYGRKLICPTNFDREHFEDPRAIFHKGKTFVSCCNFVVTNNGASWTGAHQVLCEVGRMSSDEWRVTKRLDPIYGNNGDRIGADKGMEKNWLWFFHDDLPHMVYQAWPHRIVRFSTDFHQEFVYESGSKKLPWDNGIIRGGTPPVLAPDGKEYWTFFHSSLKLNDQYRRRYYMGAYAFESKPPFRITRITPEPLLAGSSQDQWAERKPLVVFPCGSDFKDDQWLVTMGINDICSAWIKIPHEELQERMVDVVPKSRGILSVLFPGKEDETTINVSITETTPCLKDVTLICVDDNRPALAKRAVEQCTKGLNFGAVKILTAEAKGRHFEKIQPIKSLEEYSRFMVKDLTHHVKTSHALVVQWDGYILNPKKWNPDWLNHDYIGAPWKLTYGVGNGGFSLRSKKLMDALQHDEFNGSFMPEDQRICIDWRKRLEQMGIKFAPTEVARDFSVENDTYDNQFGFHSYLTRLPAWADRPKIFHHSGDAGDIIYSLPCIREKGGVLFISPNTKHAVRQSATYENTRNLIPLLNQQSYLWRAAFTGEAVHADYDLNKFRDDYKRGVCLVDAHAKAIGIAPDYTPWLQVDYPIEVQGRHIVVSRSSRYHNTLFPWKDLVAQHGSKMLFTGTEDEHADFIRQFGNIPRASTPTLLDVARLIKGAWLFIGNQSCPMAIAIGLGHDRIIQETWAGQCISLGKLNVPWDGTGDANCMVPERNMVCVTDGQLNVPKKWFG